MRFEDAIGFVLSREGGYVNDPRDPGGETKYGISKRAFPLLDIPSITIEDAKEHYRRHYWTQIRGDDLPDPWGLLLLDAAVNQGVSSAVRTAQRAANITADGVVGPETISALKTASLENYFAERLVSYTRTGLVEVFGRGWFRRVMALAFFVSASYPTNRGVE